MRRNENRYSRTTAGGSRASIFNQRRQRLPLTSAPSNNEFFPHDTFGSFHPSAGPSLPLNQEWNRTSGPALTSQSRKSPSTWRSYSPIPHPYKGATKSSAVAQPRNQPSTHHEVTANSQFIRRNYQSDQSKSRPASTFPQQPPYTQHPPNLRPQKSGYQPPPPFLDSDQKSQIVRPSKSQDEFLNKSSSESSLRILSAVIDGMRHWSQYKDKYSYLFEVVATLDSAVTTNQQGAKNFMIRTGKDVVQCVYYENEMALPRLIRGQVQRCVGNYDSSKDVLTCVSVRPAQPTEQMIFSSAVRVCDAVMRELVKSFRED